MIDTRELRPPTEARTQETRPAEEARTNEPVPSNLGRHVIVVTGRVLPVQLMARYVRAAMKRATFEELDDGSWHAEIRQARGLWAEGTTWQEAEAALRDSVEGWLILKIDDQDHDIPPFDGIDLNGL